MASHPETKIDCSKVYVKQSTFSNEATGMFDGAFAAVAIKEGEEIQSAQDMHIYHVQFNMLLIIIIIR